MTPDHTPSSPTVGAETPVPAKCEHCRNGFLDGRFGQDVECVNGVLIDIDEFYEGWARDTVYPVAPCHPQWAEQLRAHDNGDDIETDYFERLSDASAPDEDEAALSNGEHSRGGE